MKTTVRYHMISWVAERYNVHPQTLRLWEREGLLTPSRSEGNTRLYDDATCDRLETILTLTRDLGVNLAGVEIILKLREQVERLQQDVETLSQMLRQAVYSRSEVPRYNAIVRVESAPIRPMDDE